MTYLIRMRLGYNVEQTVSILKGTKKGIEEILHDKFSVYYDKSIDEICKELDINLISKNGSLPKNYAQIISSKILGIKGNKLDSIEEFSKANIKFKTVRIEKNGKIKQHMSLETFKYTEIIKRNMGRVKAKKYIFRAKNIYL